MTKLEIQQLQWRLKVIANKLDHKKKEAQRKLEHIKMLNDSLERRLKVLTVNEWAKRWES